MNNRTVNLLILLLSCAVLLFHLSAKKQPTGQEAGAFDAMVRPRSWLGRPSPDMKLDLLDGGTFALADQVGRKAIVLNFFATWCGPCQEEIPEFLRFAGRHKDDPFLLIGIDADEGEETVREFVKRFGVTYPVAIDKGGAVQRLFRVRSYPTTVFIGADGTVQLYEVGQISNADVAFEAPLAAALEAIRAGAGITREAFLQRQAGVMPAAAPAAEEKRDPADDLPPGRARDIAAKMNCLCGCTHSLMDCTCKTSKDIKARLRTMDLQGRKDEDVIKALNREFCMK